MKRLIPIIILTTMISSCAEKQKLDKHERTTTSEKLDKKTIRTSVNPQEKKEGILSEVLQFPVIRDSVEFITNLRQAFKLEVDESFDQKANEKITTYKRVKIYGTQKDHIFIEYDYGSGSGAAFPWKYQLVLSSEGKLVKKFFGQRFEFVEIFKDQHPFLMMVVGTSKGNGGHEIFKFSGDTLENVFDNELPYYLRTYDAHEDNRINEPNELNLTIKDFNNDGFNDISFVGKLVLTQGLSEYGDWYDGETIDGKEVRYSADNAFKKIPVEFVFLYDEKTTHFKMKEDYEALYKMYE